VERTLKERNKFCTAEPEKQQGHQSQSTLVDAQADRLKNLFSAPFLNNIGFSFGPQPVRSKMNFLLIQKQGCLIDSDRLGNGLRTHSLIPITSYNRAFPQPFNLDNQRMMYS